MKYALSAAALLLAAAGSAAAAEVELYGIVDLGLSYTNMDLESPGHDNVEHFSMNSGGQSASRWGLKGLEELGSGLDVGFVLESSFNADTGALYLQDDDVLFDRESSIFIEGPFGKLGMGRLGSFNQGLSSWSLSDRISAFDNDFGFFVAQPGNTFTGYGGCDNALAYRSPDFAGFQLHAMYFMGVNGYENKSGSDRLLNLAATYDNGPFSGMISFEWYNLTQAFTNIDTDDGFTLLAGASYDFGSFKLYLAGEYFNSIELYTFGGLFTESSPYLPWKIGGSQEFASQVLSLIQVDGFSLLVSAETQIAGGKLMAAASWLDAQSDSNWDMVGEFDFSRWSVSLGYDYPLSKRTNLYAVASVMEDKIDNTRGFSGQVGDWSPNVVTVGFGLRHMF